MQISTSNASGRVLDWLVATANDREVCLSDKGFLYFVIKGDRGALAHFSNSDALSGPILDANKIGTRYLESEQIWEASNDENFIDTSEGKTRLEAALRFYVSRELGNTYDIPEVLCL